MKTILSILLIFLSVGPAFCAPNWVEGANDNVKYYDVSGLQAYSKQLKNNYYKKYLVEISPTEAVINAPLNAWNNEVEVPIFEYIIKNPPKYMNN